MLTTTLFDLGPTPTAPGLPGAPPTVVPGAAPTDFTRALTDLLTGAAPAALAAGTDAGRQIAAETGKPVPVVRAAVVALPADCELIDPTLLPPVGEADAKALPAPADPGDGPAEPSQPGLESALAWLLPPPPVAARPASFIPTTPAPTGAKAPVATDSAQPLVPVPAPTIPGGEPVEPANTGRPDPLTMPVETGSPAAPAAQANRRNDAPLSTDPVDAALNDVAGRSSASAPTTKADLASVIPVSSVGVRPATPPLPGLPAGNFITAAAPPVMLPPSLNPAMTGAASASAGSVTDLQSAPVTTAAPSPLPATGPTVTPERVIATRPLDPQQAPPVTPLDPSTTIAAAPSRASRPESLIIAAVAPTRLAADPTTLSAAVADAALQPLGSVSAPLAVAPTASAQQPGIDLTRDSGLHRMIDRIEQLRESANGDWARETRIRLIPDALGPIDIAVRREREAVHVHFTATETATRQLIADAQPRLAELAEARGIRIERATVDHGGQPWSGDQARSQQHQQPATPAPRAPVRAGRDPEPQSTDERIA